MLFDANAWVGAWPFGAGRYEALPELIAALGAQGIGGAAVSPVRAVLAPEPMRWNRELLAEIRSTSGGFGLAWVPVVNPALAGWEADLDACLEEAGDAPGGVRLVPNYHSYAADDAAAIACVERVAAAGRAVVVQLRMLDERAHHPLMKVPGVDPARVVRLATAVPEARLIVAGIFMAELPLVAETANVSVELSMIENGETLPSVLRTLSPERVLLGTHAPLQMAAPAVAKLRGHGVDEAALGAIGGGNAERAFGMRATSVR